MAWRLAARGAHQEAVRALRGRVDGYRARGVADSLEAVSVAYILIRAGEFDRLDPWVSELPGSRSAPVDAIIVTAEWFAQAGCHLSAFNLLRELPKLGEFPLFSDGFSLALARLTAYASISVSGSAEFDTKERGVEVADAPGHSSTEYVASHESRDGESPANQKLPPTAIAQELTASNVREAQQVLKTYVENVRRVDWSSYLLRLSDDQPFGVGRLLRGIRDVAATRLGQGWVTVSWRLLTPIREGKAKGTEHSHD
jgi:hypothetical protein